MSAESSADSADEPDSGPGLHVELGATAGVAVAFLVLRMLAVAHWDWNVVAAISDTFDFSDAFPIAFGTVAGQPVLTGVLVAVLLPLFLLRVIWPAHHPRGEVRLTTILTLIVLIVITVTLSLTFDNLWVLVGAIAICAVVVVIRLTFRRGILNDIITAALKHLAVISALAVLALAAFNDAPWTSAERIATGDGVIIGYVLQAEPGFLHVLTADREVIILPDTDVKSRTLVD